MIRSVAPGPRRRTILFAHASDELYGSDIILLQLIDRLDPACWRVIVVLPDDVRYEGLLSAALRQRGITVHHPRLAVLRRAYFTPRGMTRYGNRLVVSTARLLRLLQQEDVAIVHSNTAAVLPGAIAAWLSRRPHIWHVHEIIVSPRALWRASAWWMPRLSARVVTVSCAAWHHLCAGNMLNRRKAVVIHNGLDVTRLDAAVGTGSHVRAGWDLARDTPLVGMVGRISSWKGQDLFLQVARRVLDTRPDVRFAIIGAASPGQEELVGRLRYHADTLGLSRAVIMPGFRSDVPSIMDALDILVLPSTSPDPFPTVVLEAMAMRRPVVALAHGGCTEMVDDGITGALVPRGPDEVSAMAQSIVRLIDDPPLRTAMGLAARQRLDQRFSVDAFVSQWQALYSALVRPSPGSRSVS